MRHSAPAQHAHRGEPQDVQIEPQRFALQVLDVELHFARNGEVVPAMRLSPARQSWHQLVHTVSSAERNQVVLVIESGTWTDEAHIAYQDAPKLRQFIQARRPNE